MPFWVWQSVDTKTPESEGAHSDNHYFLNEQTEVQRAHNLPQGHELVYKSLLTFPLPILIRAYALWERWKGVCETMEGGSLWAMHWFQRIL